MGAVRVGVSAPEKVVLLGVVRVVQGGVDSYMSLLRNE